MTHIQIDGYEPDFLLAFIRDNSKFNADLLEQWLIDLQTYKDCGSPAECKALQLELQQSQALCGMMAEYILSGVPLSCECCTNGMRNMDWNAQYKGCDGNCQHKNGIPKTPDDLLAYFKKYLPSNQTNIKADGKK